ncbi:histidine phosphotransferase family protein [Sedimentitalea todarodis]|uniref:Histidine phosphotransferase family protein n=1 Tax=Sedimentitalea todarodis TaxID=1631240 RepID=A0ABU3VAN2_9RHOB|nr:histidine phosphotransferase family protein [Sedimentitalea todarodis]MDU9003228.1 histidine phosphotransferase family protein [Sedimentitalea todarodis]
MGQSNHNLASLIGSRICHDLISPIGAITNGLELLDMAGGMQGPELELISDSVGNAGARIRFFRIAYGAAGEQMLGRTEVLSVLDDVSRGGRLRLHWSPLEPQSRACVRLAFLAIQCLETSMPYGGDANVGVEGDRWRVTGTSEKLNVDSALWAGLSAPDTLLHVTPAQVQFALMPTVAADLDRNVSTEQADGQIAICF